MAIIWIFQLFAEFEDFFLYIKMKIPIVSGGFNYLIDWLNDWLID